MHSPIRLVSNEKGIALVVAILALLMLSLLAIAFLVTTNVETKVAGSSLRDTQALSGA